MFTYHSEKVKSAVAMTALVSALYSCEEAITPVADDLENAFSLTYQYGAWNKASAKVSNDVRSFTTRNKASMEVQIDSVTLEMTPRDQTSPFTIYGYDHDNN